MQRAALVVVLSLLSAAIVAAQPAGRFDPAVFRAGERLWVTTEAVHEGSLVTADDQALVLQTASGRMTFRIADVRRIRRRTNGTTLGTLIGAGAGVAGSVPLFMLAANEGGSAGGPALLLIAAGAGGGFLVDRALGSYKVIYERPGTMGQPDRLSHGVRASFDIGPGLSRYAGESLTSSHVAAGVLFRVKESPAWAGLEVLFMRGGHQTANALGPVVQVRLPARGAAIDPYVSGGVLVAEGGPWGRAGGGIDVRVARRAALRVSLMDTFRNYERVYIGVRSPRGRINEVSLQAGLVYR